MNIRTIRRVTVGSAFKVGAVLSAVFFAVVWAPIIILEGLGLALLSSVNSSSNTYGSSGANYSSAFGAGSLIAIGCGWIVGVFVAALVGGISFALYAWIYNFTFGIHGGIRTEVVESPASLLP